MTISQPAFCNRCGTMHEAGDASHYNGACTNACPIPGSSLHTETHVRCPVEGCRWRKELKGKTTTIRTQFDLHLNWHAENNSFGKPAGGNAQPLERLETLASSLGFNETEVATWRKVQAAMCGVD
jgi:hypothetical protein